MFSYYGPIGSMLLPQQRRCSVVHELTPLMHDTAGSRRGGQKEYTDKCFEHEVPGAKSAIHHTAVLILFWLNTINVNEHVTDASNSSTITLVHDTVDVTPERYVGKSFGRRTLAVCSAILPTELYPQYADTAWCCVVRSFVRLCVCLFPLYHKLNRHTYDRNFFACVRSWPCSHRIEIQGHRWKVKNYQGQLCVLHKYLLRRAVGVLSVGGCRSVLPLRWRRRLLPGPARRAAWQLLLEV